MSKEGKHTFDRRVRRKKLPMTLYVKGPAKVTLYRDSKRELHVRIVGGRGKMSLE